MDKSSITWTMESGWWLSRMMMSGKDLYPEQIRVGDFDRPRVYYPVDRDALLALAEEIEGEGLDGWASGPLNVGEYARDADALIDMTELAWDENVQESRELLHWYGATPFRLEFVLRDFKAPKPKDIWFRYPIHEEDLSGMLEDSKPRKPGGPKAWHKKQADKALEEMESSLDEFMGERDEIDRKEFVEHIGKDARTVNKYVQQSLLFDLESGLSSATIRRIKDEG